MGNGCMGLRLPKQDLVYLLENTSFSEPQIKQWYQGFMQDCPEGQLCREKFLTIYKSWFPDGRAASFYSHVFRTFDEDRSGRLDFKEFLQAIDVTQGGLPRERIDLSFRLYDVDGSGTLEAHEILDVITAIFLMVYPDKDTDEIREEAEEKATAVYGQIDVNSDGSISREEFIGACMEDASLCQLLARGGVDETAEEQE